jgi:hypothetical protein
MLYLSQAHTPFPQQADKLKTITMRLTHPLSFFLLLATISIALGAALSNAPPSYPPSPSATSAVSLSLPHSEANTNIDLASLVSSRDNHLVKRSLSLPITVALIFGGIFGAIGLWAFYMWCIKSAVDRKSARR